MSKGSPPWVKAKKELHQTWGYSEPSGYTTINAGVIYNYINFSKNKQTKTPGLRFKSHLFTSTIALVTQQKSPKFQPQSFVQLPSVSSLCRAGTVLESPLQWKSQISKRRYSRLGVDTAGAGTVATVATVALAFAVDAMGVSAGNLDGKSIWHMWKPGIWVDFIEGFIINYLRLKKHMPWSNSGSNRMDMWLMSFLNVFFLGVPGQRDVGSCGPAYLWVGRQASILLMNPAALWRISCRANTRPEAWQGARKDQFY